MAGCNEETTQAARNEKVVEMPRRESGEDTKWSGMEGRGSRTVPTEPKRSGNRRPGKKAETEPMKEEEYKGAKKDLRRSVKKAVKSDCSGFATTLVDEAKAGNTQSTAMVLKLIENKRDGGEDGDDGPSLADELMKAPTWDEFVEAKRKAREEEAEKEQLGAA